MENQVVHVPVSRLLDTGLTASAKVIWMARCLHPSASPAELEVLTGLSRHTVLRGLASTSGSNRTAGVATVEVPVAVLGERTVGAQAKVIYGLLQATPHFSGTGGQFTYCALASLTHIGRNSLKRAVAELVAAGWVESSQKGRLDPIHFTLGSPDTKRSRNEAAEAGRRLKRARFGGEALMHEYLSLLIDSDQFTENARPGFLVNPHTGERLELDRYYPPYAGFEFHGTQHYRATGRFSQEEADAQHLRDLIKAGLCLYRGIHLVVVHAEDLSLQGMTRKIGTCLPLRNLEGHEPLIELLEDASLRYCASAHAARKSGR